MKKRSIIAVFMTAALAMSVLGGCSGSSDNNSSSDNSNSSDNSIPTGSNASEKGSSSSSNQSGDIIEFTAFFATPGAEINDDNEIKQIIAEKTNVKVKETWLTGQTASEAIGTIVAGGEYPDFIDGGDAMASLYDA